jgi:hypothetical protein
MVAFGKNSLCESNALKENVVNGVHGLRNNLRNGMRNYRRELEE